MNLLSVDKLSKTYGEKTLFEDISFGLEDGDKVGIIGVNGTGKSTLLKVIAGAEPADNGTVTIGTQVSMQMLAQNPSFDPKMTVLQHLFQGASPEMTALRAYREAMQLLELRPSDEQLQTAFVQANQLMDTLGAWQLESDGKTALTKLGITDFEAKLSSLSGGQRKRVAMAAALIQPSDILILDEPTNHIDNESVAWLESMLQKRRGALLMITHDRYFLDRVCNRIMELDLGRAFFYTANYSRFLELKLEREEREAATEDKRQNLLRSELAWMRKGAKARTTKQKARIERFEQLQRSAPERASGKLDVSVASTRLGKKIMEARGVRKGFGDKVLIRDFNYIAVPEDRVGIVGRNGSGKSTLLKLIAGKLQPDAGSVELGATVNLGWFSQEHEEMNEQLRVIEYIREAAEQVRTGDGTTITAAQMLERFLFQPAMQWTPIAKLSGGEKRRLQLLRVLMGAPNVLLLDEPTNDLDIATLTVLEDYLDDFPGVVFIVSHDRYFLDRTAERIIAFEGDGVITQHVGNYSDYQDYLIKHGNASAAPTDRAPTSASTGTRDAMDMGGQGRERERALKMSYKDQKDFEQIDDWVAETEAELERVAARVDSAGSDSVLLQELMQQQAELDAKLEKLLERWTELNELAEQIAEQKRK